MYNVTMLRLEVPGALSAEAESERQLLCRALLQRIITPKGFRVMVLGFRVLGFRV